MLVPEIALALPLVDRLRADLDARVALLHSGLGDGERADEWRRIRAGDVDIVVGTRLAVVAPLADVGLIVVDEEHDAAYKSDRTPRLQARDAAVALGRAGRRGDRPRLGDARGRERRPGANRACSTGSSCRPVRSAPPRPSRSSTCARSWRPGSAGCCRGRWPRPSPVSTRRQGSRRSSSSTGAGPRRSSCVATAGTSRPARTASGRSSTTRPGRRCAVITAAGRRRSRRAVRRAARRGSAISAGGPNASSARSARRFPGLRVARLDRDVVEHRGAAERVIDAFADGRTDVLVGTSLVAKGLDIPAVTLVGVVSSDIALNLPDERAAERTYQLLVQAIGRAGRGERPGHAIVQTYQPEHPAIMAAASGDRTAFYDAELALRERFGSPPFGRLVKLTVGLADPAAAEREAHAMADRLRERATERGAAVTVVGPAPAYIARRADRWRWNVILRGADPAGLLDGGVDAPWSVDVDPESLL